MPTSSAPRSPLTLGAILYPAFEMLDLFGPLEMFSMVGSERLVIHTVAERSGPVGAAIGNEGPVGPQVVAEFGFDDAPPLDLLLVPGGFGTVPALANERLLAFLRTRSASAQVTMSVCTGSALLAKCGALDGHRATSNKQFFSLASAQSQAVEWIEAARWVDDGPFVTSSGVSAGMDMALAVIARLFGADVAEQIAVATEYTWHRDAAVDPFVAHLNQLAALIQ